jgi:hypothetical protein
MKCLICNAETNYYFSKKYVEKPMNSFMIDIGEVEYYKCTNCGFTISKTHCELEEKRWEKLNFDFHHHIENPEDSLKDINQPPYFQQAIMIKILTENNIINFENSLDFAGGYGTLSHILLKYFDMPLSVFDPYVKNINAKELYIEKENLTKYNTVISSALFEHLKTRESFDEINDCVSDDGCLIIHTRISGYIPKDPNWFYLIPPVHCAFHTNKSMQLLMEQWSYKSSIYCLSSRCWILFKKDLGDIQNSVDLINKESQSEYLVYKKGFVDYWSGY